MIFVLNEPENGNHIGIGAGEQIFCKCNSTYLAFQFKHNRSYIMNKTGIV
jgi:hypothetical protein